MHTTDEQGSAGRADFAIRELRAADAAAVSPRGARLLGFVQTGVEPETGNFVYHMEL
jgi:hypothetical protein